MQPGCQDDATRRGTQSRNLNFHSESHETWSPLRNAWSLLETYHKNKN